MDSPRQELEPEQVDPRGSRGWELYSDKPSRFKAVLISASSDPELYIDSYEDAMEEWIYRDEVHDQLGVCICSQEIRLHHFLENSITGRIIAVGSECIKKFGTQEQRDLLGIRLRKSNYAGEKAMCCSCMKNRVDEKRSHRAVPLCEICLDSRSLEPSDQYMKAFGVPCIVCQKARVMGGSLITCCSACRRYNCCSCNAPLHDTTEGIQVSDRHWARCPYCDQLETNAFCLSCKTPLSKKWGLDGGNVECKDCKQKRHCDDCRAVLPATWKAHWRRCSSCYQKREAEKRPSEREPLMRFCPACEKVRAFRSLESWCKVCLVCFNRKG